MLGFVKSLAPQFIYFLGVVAFVMALGGKVRWSLAFVVFLLPLRNVIDRLQDFPLGTKFLTVIILAMVIGWFVSKMGHVKELFALSSLNKISILLIVYMFISLQQGNHYLNINAIFDISDPRV